MGLGGGEREKGEREGKEERRERFEIGFEFGFGFEKINIKVFMILYPLKLNRS